MIRFFSNQGTKIVKKAATGETKILNFGSFLKPTLTAAAFLGVCTTGIAYYFYKKDMEKYEEKRKIMYEKLEEQYEEERSEFIEFENIIIDLKERIKHEKDKFVEQQELGEKSLSFSKQFDIIDEKYGIETSLLTVDTVLKIFEALFYLMKDSIHGYGYATVIKKFRIKRREYIKDIRFAFNFEDVTPQNYNEYAEICALEASVINQVVIKALNRILNMIDLKKKIFDRSFLILGKSEETIRNLMRDTFTRLTSSLRCEESEKELKEKGAMDAEKLLKILEYRIKVYPKLSMFNDLEPTMRKMTRLKFMADMIFFRFRLEDEDLFIKDPENKSEENELHLNPKLKNIANKIQDLLQANF